LIYFDEDAYEKYIEKLTKTGDVGIFYMGKPGPEEELPIPVFKNKSDPEYAVLLHQYVSLKMDLAVTKAEANFREKFACWLLGQADTEQYEKCWWIKTITDPTTKKEYTLDKLDGEIISNSSNKNSSFWKLQRTDSGDPDPLEKLKLLRLELTQTLLKTKPVLAVLSGKKMTEH
jgi:hypothetical protein